MPKELKSKCCKKCVNGGKIGIPLQGCCNGCPCHSTPTKLEKILEEFDEKFEPICYDDSVNDGCNIKSFIRSHFTALLEESFWKGYETGDKYQISKKDLMEDQLSDILQIINKIKK